MFHTLTTNTTTDDTKRQHNLRTTTVAALVGLALAASACGGAAPTETAKDGAADIDLVAEVAPVVVPDNPAPTIDDEQEPAPAPEPAPTPIDDEPSTSDNPPADHDTNDTDDTDDNDTDGSESDGTDGSESDGTDDNDTPTDPVTPPTGPTRPELSDAVDQPTEAKLPDAPQADMEVAVRNVKIEAGPECFANGLDSRFFHTTHAPVAVVLDTNGISETQFTSMAHDVAELTDDLRELSISDGALRGYASRDLGYAVTVQVQGAVTGGIVVDWAQTATAPATYTSPTFSGPTDDCDISISFLVLELD